LVNDTSYNPVIEQIVGASAFFVVNDANAVLVDPILTPDVSISLDGGFFTGATGVIFLYTGGLVNLTLLADNLLEYVITALPSSQDQLEVSRAQLNFNTALRSQGVPDGGATLILLGSSLLGMGFIGRRHLAMKA
jgi:hypothetical protein